MYSMVPYRTTSVSERDVQSFEEGAATVAVDRLAVQHFLEMAITMLWRDHDLLLLHHVTVRGHSQHFLEMANYSLL